MIEWADIEALDAGLAAVSEAAQGVAVDIANGAAGAGFGSAALADRARALYGAHVATLMLQGQAQIAAGGVPVVSRSLGPQSETSGAYLAQQGALLDRTAHGRLYLLLRDAQPGVRGMGSR